MSKWTFAFLFMFLSFGKSVLGSPGANTEIRLIYLTADKSAELLIDGKQVTLQKGECAGAWTLVEILPYLSAHQLAQTCVVLEDYSHINGHLLFVNSKGIQLDLPKSSRIELSKIRSPSVFQNRGLLPWI